MPTPYLTVNVKVGQLWSEESTGRLFRIDSVIPYDPSQPYDTRYNNGAPTYRVKIEQTKRVSEAQFASGYHHLVEDVSVTNPSKWMRILRRINDFLVRCRK